MKRNYIFLCLFSLELVVVCYSHQQSPPSPYYYLSSPPNELLKKKSPPLPSPPLYIAPFDYLMLAETWPASYCKVPSCRPDIPSKFTIHGMWPQKNTAPQPRDCDPSQPFQLDAVSFFNQFITIIIVVTYSYKLIMFLCVFYQVRSLEPQLLVDWPNLESALITNRYATWSREWKLHGTCSGMSIKDYFELALKVYKNKDLKSILEKANITPNDQNSINKTKIVDAIYKDIGFYPQLDCIYLYEKLYLLEIRLCFNVLGGSNVLQYQNCRGKYTQKCYASEDIYIPINHNLKFTNKCGAKGSDQLVIDC